MDPTPAPLPVEQAMTALDTWVSGTAGDIWTAITTNLPIILGVLGGFIVIGIVLKFVKKNVKA